MTDAPVETAATLEEMVALVDNFITDFSSSTENVELYFPDPPSYARVLRSIKARLQAGERFPQAPPQPLFTPEEIAILSEVDSVAGNARRLGILEAASAAYAECEMDLRDADAINAELRARLTAAESELERSEKRTAEWREVAAAAEIRVRELTEAKPHFFDKRAADTLAREVSKLIQRQIISERSPAADALLDYSQELYASARAVPAPIQEGERQ